MQRTWIRSIGIIALVAGLWFADYDLWVKPATAAPPEKETPQGTVTQNWDMNLPSDSRFTVLSALGGAAVRDNNTGLVWEQAIDLTNRVWAQALAFCANKNVGGTVGWRLSSVVELKSVQEPSLPSPSVNSVFTSTGILSFNNWWSATTSTVNSGDAWIVDINDGRGMVTVSPPVKDSRGVCVVR